MYCRDRARNILTAWGEGNQVRVRQLLNNGNRAGYASSAEEQERNELLDGIRAGLAGGSVNADEPVVSVSLRLLRHLAASCN